VTAFNADTRLNTTYIASNSTNIITFTNLLPGVVTQTCTSSVHGGSATTTAVTTASPFSNGVAGDTVTSIASAVKAAMLAVPGIAALVAVTQAAGVLTLTAKQKGTAANTIVLATAVTGAGATVTMTNPVALGNGLSGSTAGTGRDDILLITA
jgi:phage tail sheath gpL-like